MAATTISRAAMVDSTSASTGDIVNAAFFSADVYDKIDALFTANLTLSRPSAGDIAFTVENASNTAGSDAQLKATVAGTSAGDPYATFTVTSGSSWSIGADNDSGDPFKISLGTAVGTNEFVITTAGLVVIGGASNAFMTVGLTINQGGNDNEILSLKSSDIAHGITGLAEADTFATFSKKSATAGGLQIIGYTTGVEGLLYRGYTGTVDTTKGVGASGAIYMLGALRSGVSVGSLGANANIAAFTDNGTTRFILDSDGDSHQDVGTAWTNFDFLEDADALTALAVGVSQPDDPLRTAFGHLLERYRPELEQHRLVTFNEDGHHFINWSRTSMLLIGAVRQQAERLAALDAYVRALPSA